MDVEVVPIHGFKGEISHYLILFKRTKKASGHAKRPAGHALKEIIELKRDLLLAKESLMAIMKDQGIAAEEYRCQNEEIQSSNEEFQSTNEELETAKEELQSANEELTTVNNEMEARNSELTLANDDLSNLIQSIHTPVVLVDGNLRIRRFTMKAKKSIGLAQSDIGRKIADVGLNVPVTNLERFLLEVIDTLEVKEREIQVGNDCWYLMRARPYRRQDGSIDGAVLMFIDISAMKHGMALIQDAKKYSETIVETLWEPLVALDSSLKVKSANKAFYEFFKVNKNETDNKLVYDLGNGQWNIPELRELLEELIVKNNSFYNLEMMHDFPKIGHKQMLLNAHKVSLLGEKSEEIIILAFQDVTEQKHAEESLNKIAAELSYSNRELDNFASTAAHDLQSPLNKIHTFAERLLGESISEKGKTYLNTMIKSSQRMANLVENLLRVSRVAGQGHERERVNLEDVVREVISDLEMPIQECSAVIECAKLPTVTANHVQMRQLFQNLIGNAIKYRRKDVSPCVSVTSRLVGDFMEIAVRDNGIGFDEKYSHDVFKPFKRLHGTSEYEGSGIGLALCQKIVRHHGGEIVVSSKPGEGATFTLKWPTKMVVSPSGSKAL